MLVRESEKLMKVFEILPLTDLSGKSVRRGVTRATEDAGQCNQSLCRDSVFDHRLEFRYLHLHDANTKHKILYENSSA